ncbi:hypothetical protein SS50377_20674 [Spironucleus salmonicida]|uniref:Uncharacterized protein n=1 Tax=Spironucleus salmonicida TaxID=348837 RepID=V6LZ21_9EUKA|nr:hypothetical protein SS50377_20674 [Spironucleus salmonicida]|eukprot:EST49523.1 Hypothetical protein SS50377_10126 [Spironucleus salmonicida]
MTAQLILRTFDFPSQKSETKAVKQQQQRSFSLMDLIAEKHAEIRSYKKESYQGCRTRGTIGYLQ